MGTHTFKFHFWGSLEPGFYDVVVCAKTEDFPKESDLLDGFRGTLGKLKQNIEEYIAVAEGPAMYIVACA